MGSTNSTPNINLPQFLDDDRPSWRGDINGAFNTVDTHIGSLSAIVPDNGAKAVGKNELIVSAKDYGAKCDGITDDTAAIQTALDSLPANGGVVTIPVTAQTTIINGQLHIDTLKELHLPAGCTLIRQNSNTSETTPMIVLCGNFAALTGFGSVISQNDSPNGIINIGPRTPTKANYAASMTSGSPNLTISGGTLFSDSDVGKSVSVKGAGNNGAWCTGTIVSVNDSQNVTLSTNAQTTISNGIAYWGMQTPVAWCRVDACVTGNGGANSEGVSLYSSPQGQTGLTVGTVVRGQISSVARGIGFNYQANGNTALGLQFYRIGSMAISFNDCVENNIIGGFVHSSQNLTTVINSVMGVYNNVTGMQGEPGNGCSYQIDTASNNNVFILNMNTPGSNTNNGVNNYIQQNSTVYGQRVNASDGVVIPIKSGGFASTDFIKTAVSGLLSANSTTGNSQLEVLVGAVKKTVAVWSRVLTATTNKTPGLINANASYETPITVTGALPGDKVNVSLNPMPVAGIVWNASVTANDTVTLRMTNVSGAAITPSTTSVRVDVQGA